jgi:glycosyltransferase involved in cell wall biosynthesis
MDLSIVIPVYNEREKIETDVTAAAEFFRRRGLDGEILVVDDGSWDGTAREAERAGASSGVTIRVMRTPHRGKGHAVRTGIAAAWGRVVGFVDSGLCVPYDDLLPGIGWIRSGECDIAHGSRKLESSTIHRPQGWRRRAASWIFRRMVLHAFDLPRHLTDTQVGCKLYRREVGHELYAECLSDGFVFDVEVIVFASRAGYRIREFPIHWTSDPDSRLSLTRVPRGLLRELNALKRRLA